MSIHQKKDHNRASNTEENPANEKLKNFEKAFDKYEEISEDAYKQNSIYRAISEISSKEHKAA